MGVKDSFLGRLLGSADKFSDEQVAQTITMLVEHAVKHRASDIHIEPHERFGLVRYRIDGTLRGIHKLPVASLPMIAEQVKELAGLHTDENQLPQEGQYAALAQGEQFEVQVSTLPVIGGEKIVLHLSRRLSKPLSLEALGFWGSGADKIRETLARSHGLILVAAPRRNGKTTTMHSMLQLLNTPSISIATVESAIEYRLPGASQTRVRPHHGITYHAGLQAALNQDPNVVMISGLPDKQTTDSTIQAAMGGHLVIAGLHADNASTALSHLRSMSDEPFLLTTALRLVVSQRLVRRLCVHCRERFIPSPEQLAEIDRAFGINSSSSRRKIHELEQAAAHAGIDSNAHVNTTPQRITSLWRASDAGCEACSHTGYEGVIAIAEVLAMSPNLQKAVLNHESAPAMHNLALKEGFVPMALDGLIKALRGQTTTAEVLRTSPI